MLVITQNNSVHFQNNHAINYGGAIYIVTDEYYNKSVSINELVFLYPRPSMDNPIVTPSVTPRTRCFLSVKSKRLQARLIFTNNTADKGGDVVYGGLVAMGYDGD